MAGIPTWPLAKDASVRLVFPREDSVAADRFRIFELPEAMAQGISQGQVVTVKGFKEDSATLCTGGETYAVRLAETTNTLILVGGRAVVPAVTGAQDGNAMDESGGGSESAKAREQGEAAGAASAEDLAAAAAKAAVEALPTAPVLATGIKSYCELARIAPRLDRLREMLQTKAYDGRDAAAVALAAEPAPGGKARYFATEKELQAEAARCGAWTLEELEANVQASSAEIATGLHALGALELESGRWVCLDKRYTWWVMDLVLARCVLEGWKLTEPIPVSQCCELLSSHCPSRITAHVLSLFSTTRASQGAPCLEGTTLLLSHVKVCQFRAEELLSSSGNKWRCNDFMTKWEEVCPDELQPEKKVRSG